LDKKITDRFDAPLRLTSMLQLGKGFPSLLAKGIAKLRRRESWYE
jgi:hypothetical protein